MSIKGQVFSGKDSATTRQLTSKIGKKNTCHLNLLEVAYIIHEVSH